MFTTYSASAGSGKTTQLVADYLTLCFRPGAVALQTVTSVIQESYTTYRKILAITFTNNAAAEMKDRILQCLNTFAFKSFSDFSGSDKAIYGKIATRLFPATTLSETKVENFIRQEALGVLRHIVYDYARFTLTTIDSFFQRIIRSSALMLHLNLNYAVQITADEYYLEVTNQILNELSENPELSGKISYLLEHKMEEKGKLNIDNEFKKVLDMAYEEKSFLPTLALDKKELAASIKNWSGKIKALNFNLEGPRNQISEWTEQLNSLKNELKGLSKKNSKYQELDQQKQTLSELLAQAKEQCNAINVEVVIYKALLENADWLSVMSDLKAKMDELTTRDNIFLLGKSNQLIYNTIYGENESMTLFEKIKFSHFFIDEFQDTSQMQWDDLIPLLKNNALDVTGDVTLFGDLKQAIYRFRNGDAEIFYNLIDGSRFRDLPDFKNVTEPNYRNIHLDTNYRSSQSVIRFNNTFFQYLLSPSHPAELEDITATVSKKESYYQDVAQHIPANNDKKGLVKVVLSIPSAQTEFITPKGNTVDAETYHILRAVEDAIQRGYTYHDIAVLTSSNVNAAKFADALLKDGYPVISDAFLSLDSSQAIDVIISTIKLLYTPNDRLAQASILHRLNTSKGASPNSNQPDTDLFKMSSILDFFEFLDVKYDIKINRTYWLLKPLFLLVKDIINLFRLDYVADINNEQRSDPYVAEFLNVVQQYAGTRNNDPYKFLVWWQQCLDLSTVPCLTFPKGVNAVTVSTIHKSKGLEYPVVLFYYTMPSQRLKPVWLVCPENQIFGPSSSEKTVVSYIELNKDNCVNSIFTEAYNKESELSQLDTLNLQYVAHTRAKDMLYVISKTKVKGKKMYGDTLLAFMDGQNQGDKSLFTKTFEDESTLEYDFGDSDWQKPGNVEEATATDTLQIRVSNFNFYTQNVIHTVQESDTQRLTGLYVHDFLAKLSAFPQNDTEIEQILVGVPEDKKTDLRKSLNKLITDPDLKSYFAADVNVLNEMSILDTKGEMHRPDRIVFLGNRVVILDYKTGAPMLQHQQQIDRYCQLMKEMGYQEVEGKLIYL